MKNMSIKNISYFDEKRRFLIFGAGLFLMLVLAVYLLKIAYARYEVQASIYSDIDQALYVFEAGDMSFNLDPEGIVPKNGKYVYKFSVANFNESKISDVDLIYNLKVITTTNLPITCEIYRNSPDISTGTNLIQGSRVVTDEDGAWYKIYNVDGTYELDYSDKTTDVYSLVIDFPLNYANDTTYANSIESIEINLHSEQMI